MYNSSASTQRVQILRLWISLNMLSQLGLRGLYGRWASAFSFLPVLTTSHSHKSHISQKNHILQLLYCIFRSASQADNCESDAFSQNLINVNYKWKKNTMMLTEIDAKHNGLEEDRGREPRRWNSVEGAVGGNDGKTKKMREGLCV